MDDITAGNRLDRPNFLQNVGSWGWAQAFCNRWQPHRLPMRKVPTCRART